METQNVELGRYQFAHESRISSTIFDSSVASSFDVNRREPTENCAFFFSDSAQFIAYVTLSRRRFYYHKISRYCHRVARISSHAKSPRLAIVIFSVEILYMYFLIASRPLVLSEKPRDSRNYIIYMRKFYLLNIYTHIMVSVYSIIFRTV